MLNQKNILNLTAVDAADNLRQLDTITQGDLRRLNEIMEKNPGNRTLGEYQWLISTYNRYFNTVVYRRRFI